MLVLKGVLIDFGNTLAYVDEERDRKYREEIVSILEEHGYRKTLDDLTSLLYDAYRSSSKGEVKDIYEFWELFLKSMGISENPQLIEKLTELWNSHVPKIFKLYDGVYSILSALRKKYKLALVSNCAVGLSDVIRALGLTRFFECIILSYEVRLTKPDNRIYLEALHRLELTPRECIFVSDEIGDLEGAREVGLKTILVRQGGRTMHKAKDPNFKPDLECNHISEIVQFL